VRDPYFKRCRCRDEDGKDLGADCPDLRRKGGGWNPHHGTWGYRLELPKGEGGRRRPAMRRSGFTTRTDAENARKKAIQELWGGTDPSDGTTAGKYIDDWLGARRNLKPTTRRGYEQMLRIYIRPLLGHVQLRDLDMGLVAGMFATIDQWNADLTKGIQRSAYQRRCGPETMRRIRSFLHAVLETARAERRVTINAADLVKFEGDDEDRLPPIVAWSEEMVAGFWAEVTGRIAAGPKQNRYRLWRRRELRPGAVMVWTPAQAGHFLDAVHGTWDEALYEMAFDTGMRRGELAGLQWPMVDLDRLRVGVIRTRVAVGWDVIEATPKSRAGVRWVDITSETGESLARLRGRQDEARLALGEAWHVSKYVFTDEAGVPLHPQAMSSRFLRCAYEADLPPITFHGGRHVTATLMKEAGIADRDISQKLGHSSEGMSRRYQAVLPETARQDAEKVRRMIPRRRSRRPDEHPSVTHEPGEAAAE
jgi:integrase